MNLKKRKSLYLKARQVYYDDPEGNQVMTDPDFDRLEQSIKRDDPDWYVLRTTGHTKKSDQDLPKFMPSLSKVYEWPGQQSAKGHIITPKLDGTALLLHYSNGKPIGLFTRGNGISGGNVSYLLPLITSIPKKIPCKEDVYLRCEGIMRRRVFENKWKRKNPKDLTLYKTARAAVNGQFNRTLGEIDLELLSNIDLVVVGVYDKPVSTMLPWAKKQGFLTVPHIPHTELNHDVLCKLLKKAEAGPYSVDGLVLSVKTANLELKNADLPAFMIAFKQNDSGVSTKVIDVIWQISRYGRYTPVAVLEPVIFDGVEVERATAHNARMVIDRGIGPGAVISLVRSGEVIPFIANVLKPAKPNIPDNSEWKGVHLYSTNTDYKMQIAVASTLQLLRGLGIKHVAEKSLTALYNVGFKSLADFYKLSPAKLHTALSMTLGKVAGQKFFDSLEVLNKVGLPFSIFASCSGIMGEGVGQRRISLLAKHIALVDLLKQKPVVLYNRIRKIPQFGDITARTIVKACKPLRKEYRRYVEAGVNIPVPDAPVATTIVGGKYSGKVAVWTGYRNLDQQREWEEGGGTIGSSINGKTTHVFYNPAGKFMDKVNRAKDAGKIVTTWQEFIGV